MKNRKKLLATLAITATFLAPSAAHVFADTNPPATAEQQQVDKTKEELNKLLSTFKDEEKTDMSDAVKKGQFADANYDAKTVTVDGSRFYVYVLDEKNNTSDEAKGMIALYKQSEQTHKVDVGVVMPAYYKDGILILSRGVESDAINKILNEKFISVLNPEVKAPAATTPAQQPAAQQPAAQQPVAQQPAAQQPVAQQPGQQQKSNNIIDEIVKNSLFTKVEDMAADQLKNTYSSHGKEVTVDGLRYSISIVDQNIINNLSSIMKDYVLGQFKEAETTHLYGGDMPAYYKDGVLIKFAENKFRGGSQNANYTPANLEKAKTVVSKIKEIMENTGIKNETKIDTSAVKAPSTQSSAQDSTESSGGAWASAGSFDDASGGFGDASSSGFGDSTSSFANPETYDSSALGFVGLFTTSITGLLASVGIRKRK